MLWHIHWIELGWSSQVLALELRAPPLASSLAHGSSEHPGYLSRFLSRQGAWMFWVVMCACYSLRYCGPGTRHT